MGEPPQKGAIKWAEKAAGLLRAGPLGRLRRGRQPHRLDRALPRITAAATGEGQRDPAARNARPPAVLGRRGKKSVKVISGGEQGRMLFGKLMLSRPQRAADGRATNPSTWIDQVAQHRPGQVQRRAGVRLPRPQFVSSLATRIIGSSTTRSSLPRDVRRVSQSQGLD